MRRLPGNCLYTAVTVARGGNGDENALRQIATQWLLQEHHNNPGHEIFQYGEVNAMVLIVSAPQAWNDDAGDLSAVVLAYSLGIELHVVTQAATYIFNRGNGPIVNVYHYADHYTAEPVEDVHTGDSKKVYSKPKKKKTPVKKDIYESKESEDMESEVEDELDLEPQVKAPRNYLTTEREQELRVLMRGLGAQPRLSAADTSVMRIMRRALEEEFLSKSDEGLIKTYCYYLDKQKGNSSAPVTPPYAIGGIPCSRKQMIDHINNNIPDNGLGDVSGAVNDMELGRGKATTGYAGVLHASAGKGKGAKGGCTLFFTRDRQGNLNLVGVGQHTGSSSYQIFWSSIGMPNNIQL